MTHDIRFPIFLSLLTLLATSSALLLAVFGIHWGALARPEVLNHACTYVFHTLAVIGFVIWPIARIDRPRKASQLHLDLCAILISAAPAMMTAWWVSEYSWSQASGGLLIILVLLAAIGSVLAAATLASLSARVLMQSVLLLWYMTGLFSIYFFSEFLPADSGLAAALAPINHLNRPIPLADILLPVILLASLAVLLNVATFVITQRQEKRARILADANLPASSAAK